MSRDQFLAVFPGVKVDDQFLSGVMADGVVTRAELEQAYMRTFECILQTGATGEVWLYLDLKPSGALSIVQPEGSGNAGGQIGDFCSGLYLDRALFKYMDTHPETPALREQKKKLALACLSARSSQLYAKVDSAWSWEQLGTELRPIAEDMSRQGSDAGPIFQACIDDLGLPLKDLATFVGSGPRATS